MTIDDVRDEPRLSREHTGQARWAYLLAEHHADEIMHVTGIGWHHYDDTRWVEDPDGVHPTRLLLALLRTGRSQERWTRTRWPRSSRASAPLGLTVCCPSRRSSRSSTGPSRTSTRIRTC
ncbi:hypothetical protein GS425_05425 [Rhodococcus hoagii]|nr:hypothetical protein [Prescottella equi]